MNDVKYLLSIYRGDKDIISGAAHLDNYLKLLEPLYLNKRSYPVEVWLATIVKGKWKFKDLIGIVPVKK